VVSTRFTRVDRVDGVVGVGSEKAVDRSTAFTEPRRRNNAADRALTLRRAFVGNDDSVVDNRITFPHLGVIFDRTRRKTRRHSARNRVDPVAGLSDIRDKPNRQASRESRGSLCATLEFADTVAC